MHSRILKTAILTLITGGIAMTTLSAENLARLKGVEVLTDSTYKGHNIPSLTDGEVPSPGGCTRPNTWIAWSSGEHWVEIQWPQSQKISEVVVFWGRLGARTDSFDPRAYKVQYWDGQAFKDVSSTREWKDCISVELVSTVVFDPVETSRIRVLQKKNGGCIAYPSIMAVREVEVYRDSTPEDALFLDPNYEDKPTNLALLGTTDSRIAQIVSWNDKGQAAVLESLNVTDPRTAADIPSGNVGIQWFREQMANRIVLNWEKAPSDTSCAVELFDGNEWRQVDSAVTPTNNLWQIKFRDLCTRQLRVRFASPIKDARLAAFEVYDDRPRDGTHPKKYRTDELQKEILAKEEDPSYELISSYAHGLVGRGLLGFKEDPMETGVNWDGAILNRHILPYLGFSCGETQLLPFGYNADGLRRSLLKGYLPAVSVEYVHGGMDYEQTAFVMQLPDSTKEATFVRVTVHNPGKKDRDVTLAARIVGIMYGKKLHAETVEGKQKIYNSQNNLILVCSEAGKLIDDVRKVLLFEMTIPAGGEQTLEFIQPKFRTRAADEEKILALNYETMEQKMVAFWDGLLEKGAKIRVPDDRLSRLHKQLVIQQFICADGDKMVYGAYPSPYDGNTYGGEEGFPCLALMYSGQEEDGKKYITYTELNRSALPRKDKYEVYEDRNQQLKHGYIPWQACETYFITRDEAWFRKVLPLLKESADWVIKRRESTMELVDGKKPLHWGLLPKWARGGDLTDLQYSLRSNCLCWRAMHNLGLALMQLGETKDGEYYLARAKDYHDRIIEVVDRITDRSEDPPFIPHMVYATRAELLSGDSAEYYQLTASNQLLDPEFFDPNGPRARILTDFFEKTNRIFLGLVRWRLHGQDMDALYSGGYIKNKLLQGEVKEFILGMYAYLAFNVDRGVLVSPETEKLYTTNHRRSIQEALYPLSGSMLATSTPLPSATARFFRYFLRPALLLERGNGKCGGMSDLWICKAAPKHWFDDGDKIEVVDAPTFFGKITFTIESQISKGTITARLSALEDTPEVIKLRIRHPDGKPMKSVTVNGKKWTDFDKEQELVFLRGVDGEIEVVAKY